MVASRLCRMGTELRRTQTSPAPPCASDDPEPEAVMPPGSCYVDGVSGLRFNEIHPDVYTDGG